MLTSTLYSKFPSISYAGSIVTNITVRLKFQEMVEKNLLVFYPYTVSEGERADTIAYSYYGDSNYAWLVYLANNIVDPVSEWPKTEEQLKRHITSTYGSIERAIKKTMFYRVDWASDDSMISPAAYNALPSTLRQYWQPVLDQKRNPIRYERAREDWVIDTNKIVELQTSGLVVNGMRVAGVDVGDTVYQLTGGNRSASGEVVAVSDATQHFVITVKHVEGVFVGDGKTTYSDTTSSAVGSCSYTKALAEPLAAAEAAYWVPVSAFDYETELNESRKSIQIIDVRYLDIIERDIRRLLA